MKPIQVFLEGERYAEAYLALHQAQRAWHQMDAALVDAQCLETELGRAQEALAALDRHLSRLRTLLVS